LTRKLTIFCFFTSYNVYIWYIIVNKQGFDDSTAKQFISKNIPLGDRIRSDILEIFRSYEEESFKTKIGVA